MKERKRLRSRIEIADVLLHDALCSHYLDWDLVGLDIMLTGSLANMHIAQFTCSLFNAR